ncbi:DUF4153 domain-containing protein [Spongiactinospora sp. TRM90649]|uniref:DUF4153 domain-containing protein n=1 Tax=Spongiactinospora sp. TRM90649 TaxID=3031114 RepID=UPI0023F9272B|nr:DUF4153 domain-containing protein [Spongiactinospora sp. TRM90649]MDF5751032.1 DUF4173 domain-containing protein [Spongiactinospora sp. TRM90649]
MRPLDFLGRIKVKLGVVIVLAVAVAFVVNEVGINSGIPRDVRIAVAVLLAVVMVQLMARGMTRPLREMAAAAHIIAKGRYGERVRATSRDEVGELARAFNAMAADLGEVDRQRRELIANVSHELRTPITALRAVLENIVDGVSTADPQTLGTALAQTERLGKLVGQLLDLSRLDSGALLIDMDTVGLEPLIEQARREATLARDDVTVRGEVTPDLTVRADPALLAQVLANLLDNAVRHSPPGGTVTVAAETGGAGIRILVRDQGAGIPEDERAHVFERFSRLDPARAADAGGSGLGLAIVKEIVELHGGTVRIEDGPGCRMVVELPGRIVVMADPPPEEAPAEVPEVVAVAAPPVEEPQVRKPVLAAVGRGGPAMFTFPVGEESGMSTAPRTEETPAETMEGTEGTEGTVSPVSPVGAAGTATPSGSTSTASPDGTPAPEPPPAQVAGSMAPAVPPEAPPSAGPPGPATPAEPSDVPPDGPSATAPAVPVGMPRPPGPGGPGGGWERPAGGQWPPLPPPPHITSYPRNWGMALAFGIVGAFFGMVGGVIAGVVLSMVDALAVMFVGALMLAAGAFTGIVIGATRIADPLPRPQTHLPAPPNRPQRPMPGPMPDPVPAPVPMPVSPSSAVASPVAPPRGKEVEKDGVPLPQPPPPPYRPQGVQPVYTPPPLFPRPTVPDMPRWGLPAIVAAGLLAAVLVPYGAPGIGIAIVAVVMGAAVLPAVWHRLDRWSIALALIGYALIGTVTFLDAEWVVFPSMLAGFCLVSLALSGAGRGWLGVLRGGASVLLALLPLPWFLGHPLRAVGRRRPRKLGHVAAGIALTLGLLGIFGALFASADPVFFSYVDALLTVPSWLNTVPARVAAFLICAVLVGAGLLVGLRPVNEPVAPRVGLRVGRSVWALPLVALNLLFTAFVAVQISVLFGGNRRVVSTAGLTYADYAREGFFQLLVVSVFVLAVVAMAAATISVRGGERWAMGLLLGMLCVLTMVILASAMHRLGLYTAAYGLTRLRASVGATIIWLAVVFLLVIVAGAVRLALRSGGGWLPRALVAVTGLGLVAFAVWNPDLRVAQTQFEARKTVERLDADYLNELGAEAVPALDRLPDPMRSCVINDVAIENGLYRPDSWNGWNLARQRAREVIAKRPPKAGVSCPVSAYRTESGNP